MGSIKQVPGVAFPGKKALGTRLIADNVTVGETALPVSPTAFVWPNVRVADGQYDASTGVITIARDCFFTSVANWTTHIGAGQADIYADAEFFVGGQWVRGANSGRREVIRNLDGYRVVSFGFAGFFPAGTMLRFVTWASSAFAHIDTTIVNGSTFAAARLTYSTIYGSTEV